MSLLSNSSHRGSPASPASPASPIMDRHVQDEIRGLREENQRLEELLSTARAERDDIGIRYDAVSERVRFLILSVFRNISMQSQTVHN